MSKWEMNDLFCNFKNYDSDKLFGMGSVADLVLLEQLV